VTRARRSAAPGGGEAGFTLVETLVTMVAATIVLFAILQGADVFRSTTEASSRRTDAQEQLRRTVRTIVTDVRQSITPAGATTPLVPVGGAVSPSDLVVRAMVTSGSGSQQGWIRYCVSSDGRSLLAGQSTAASPPAGACGTGGTGWTYGALVSDRLRDGDRLFTYTADADVSGYGCAASSTGPCLPPPSAVRGIGIRLAVGQDAGHQPLVTTDAVSLRNRTP